MKTFLSVCVIAVFCIAMSLQSTPHESCTDGPLPKELRVKECNNTPCPFYKGTDLIAQWDFVAVADAEKLKPRVKVTFMKITINYPYPEQDACKSLTNAECPLETGDEATYNLRMPISKSYPALDLVIEFALLDEHNNVHVCFKLKGKVTDK